MRPVMDPARGQNWPLPLALVKPLSSVPFEHLRRMGVSPAKLKTAIKEASYSARQPGQPGQPNRVNRVKISKLHHAFPNRFRWTPSILNLNRLGFRNRVNRVTTTSSLDILFVVYGKTTKEICGPTAMTELKPMSRSST